MKSAKTMVVGLAVLMALGLVLGISAQTTGGSLAGKVTDEQDRPVAGAVVEVRGPALQAFLRAATDAEGRYLLPFVPPGRDYEVKAEAPGMSTVIRKGIEVPLGTTVSLPFTLGPGQTEIQVSAAGPTVDVRSAASGMSISDTLIEALPLSRWAGDLAFLVPTVVDSGPSTYNDPAIAGSTGAENNYLVNGLDMTNARWGTNSTNMNFDFLQEMQVLTGGLPPEYGATMGGVTNAITRSGGNEFHGSAYAYYVSDKLQAKPVYYPYNWTFISNDGADEYDLGGTLGGFLVKDKLWFYVAYDYHSDVEYTDYPSAPEYGDQYLYLNGAPARSVYTGQRFNNFTWINPTYALKITWNAGPNHKLALSAFGNATRVYDSRFPTLTMINAKNETKTTVYNLALQWNATWSPAFFSELDLGYRHEAVDLLASPGAMADYLYYYRYSGFEALPADNTVAPVSVNGIRIDLGGNFRPVSGWGGAGSRRVASWQGRFKATNLFSGAGRHELSYGLQVQKSDWANDTAYSGPQGFVSPSTHLPAMVQSIAWWATNAPGPNGEKYLYHASELLTPTLTPSSERYAAVWANDDWSLTDFFTLKLGLRYDQEKLTGERTGSSIDLAGNWAPRLGFTWDPAHDGKSKLYGFLGRYFERVPLDLSQICLNNQITAAERFYDPRLTEWTGWARVYNYQTYIQGQDVPPAGQLTPAQAAAYSHTLEAPYTDEFVLGYQYQVKPDLTLGARIIYRELGRTIDDLSYDGGATFVIANPDRWTRVPIPGLYIPYSVDCPEPVRRYEALELTFDKRYSHNWQLGGSIVYSRLKGNYEGVANNDYEGGFHPNINPVCDLADTIVNSCGFLPLDRTYVMKAYGSYDFTDVPLQISGVLHIQSGTPISQWIEPWWEGYHVLAFPRGSYGRTPWTWTLDVGLQYTFKLPMKSNLGIRADVFNVTNENKPTTVSQIWAYQVNQGGPLFPDPLFGKPLSNQYPRTLRLALRWTF